LNRTRRAAYSCKVHSADTVSRAGAGQQVPILPRQSPCRALCICPAVLRCAVLCSGNILAWDTAPKFEAGARIPRSEP
jgi:hypothetical protein